VSVFDFVTDRLATGGAVATLGDAQELVAAGVTHVLNVADDADDGPLLSKLPVVLLCNPSGDRPPWPSKSPEWFARSLAFALPALAVPGSRVYAHCAQGLNRGPSTAYAILRALGLGPTMAEAIVRAARPQVGLRYARDADAAIAALGYGR